MCFLMVRRSILARRATSSKGRNADRAENNNVQADHEHPRCQLQPRPCALTMRRVSLFYNHPRNDVSGGADGHIIFL